MHFTSFIPSFLPSSRLAGLAATWMMMAASAASAAGGQWDSPAVGAGGSGASSATPWIGTPAAGSAYAEWNVILGYPVDDTPDIAGNGTLTETTGTAFATGSGNIYGFSGPTSFTLDLTGGTGGSGGTWDVYLRVAALGSVVDEVATLNGVNATRVTTFTGAASGGFGGAEEESLWRWTVGGAGTWSFGFGASAAHMSLDQVAAYAVQTSAVPEPESLALMGAGLAAMTAMAVMRGRRQAR